MEEKPKSIWNPRWPGAREAKLRLLAIVGVLLPLSWACFAFCVDSWAVPMQTDEDWRHIFEWLVILSAGVAVVFLASLLPVLGPVQRFLNWLFSPRIRRRLAIAGIWGATIIVLLFALDNWTGSRAWNSYRSQFEARGVPLDFTVYIPKPMPDEENFAVNPAVQSWFKRVDRKLADGVVEPFDDYWQDDYALILRQAADSSPSSNRQLTDLVTWAANFEIVSKGETNHLSKLGTGKLDLAARAAAAPRVLAGLEARRSVLAQLARASQRTQCRYPVIYNLQNPVGILLPHLHNLRDACNRLQLRARAELALGRSDEAMADVRLMLYLGDSVKNEPFLISGLVRIACLQTAVNVVWEGLAEHAWSDAQLQELQGRFEQYNFPADVKRQFHAELASDVLVMELARTRGFGVLVELGDQGRATVADRRAADWWGGFIPSGWFQREKIAFCELFNGMTEGVMDAETKTISPGHAISNEDAFNRALKGGGDFTAVVSAFWNHRIFAANLLPALNRIAVKTASAQVAANQAAIACALERYRLANGNFPETLDALAPKFISQVPRDVIGGELMKYHRTSDGQFVLYSVGWNIKDDGGVPGKNLFDEQQGDWVWEYPRK
jgi:hypothetical protein